MRSGIGAISILREKLLRTPSLAGWIKCGGTKLIREKTKGSPGQMSRSKVRAAPLGMLPGILFSFSRCASMIIRRRRSSRSKSDMCSSLFDLEWAVFVAPIEVVDFIFLKGRGLDSVLSLTMLALCEISTTSLRFRRLRNSRAIFSRVVPRFFGVGGVGCVCARGGDAGSGLLMVEMFVLLPVLPLVEGRSPVAKLTPESARRSVRRDASTSASKCSGPVISRHSSMTPLAVLRYLSTMSRTTVQPLSSPGR